ncbi:hypothetical protein COP2_027242 [Malus domestica]
MEQLSFLNQGDLHLDNQVLDGDFNLTTRRVSGNVVVPVDHETKMVSFKREPGGANAEVSEAYVDDFFTNKQTVERQSPNLVLPLLRLYQYESSDSSSSLQGSPSENRNFRSDVDFTETKSHLSLAKVQTIMDHCR